MENGPFEDVFPIENGDIPLLLSTEEILHRLIGSLSHYLQCFFYIPGFMATWLGKVWQIGKVPTPLEVLREGCDDKHYPGNISLPKTLLKMISLLQIWNMLVP